MGSVRARLASAKRLSSHIKAAIADRSRFWRLTFVILLGGFLLWFLYLDQRPNSPVSLESGSLTRIAQFSISSHAASGTLSLKLQTRMLDVTPADSNTHKGEWLRIAVDTPRRSCTALSKDISIVCRKRDAVAREGLTFSWPRAELLTMSSTHLELLDFYPGDTSANETDIAVADPSGAQLEASCLVASTSITFIGDTSNGSVSAKEECSLPPSQWLVIRFWMPLADVQSKPGQAPLALNGLSSVSLVAAGGAASFCGGPTDVTVGTTVIPLVGEASGVAAVSNACQGTTAFGTLPPDASNELLIDAAGKGVFASFDGAPESGALTIAAGAATDARVNRVELIPTHFSRQRDVWLGVAGVVAGLWLADFLDVFSFSWLARLASELFRWLLRSALWLGRFVAGLWPR